MKKIFILFLIAIILIFPCGCSSDKSSGQYTCTIRISCEDIIANTDMLEQSKLALVPENGILLDDFTVSFSDGKTVFDILLSAVRENNIHMEYSTSPVFNTAYIEGIGNIYEFDCGAMSGWTYIVNGESPSIGCSSYTVSDGDIIEFYYSCMLNG